MDTVTETATPAAPANGSQDEAAAVNALKALIDDPNALPIDKAEAVEAYGAAFNLSPTKLGKNVGRSEPWARQMTNIAKLPADVKAKARSNRTSFAELRAIEARYGSSTNESTASTDSRPYQTPQSTGSTGPVQAKYASTSADPRGFPLIRDTVNAFSKLLWWVHDSHFGEIVERWLLYFGAKGWLKVTLVALVLGMAGIGSWQTVRYIRSHYADFAYRFKTAIHQTATSPSAPHIYETHPAPGNRLQMKWTAVPGAVKYRIYWHSPDDQDIEHIGEDVTTLGAIVDVQPTHGKGTITVQGISAGDIPSPHSEKIGFVPNGENYFDTVWPLADQGGGAPPTVAPAGSKPGPITKRGGSRPEARRDDVSNSAVPPTVSNSSLSPRPSVLDSNDATQLLQSGLPQNGGIAQRLGNALAVIAGKTVTGGGSAGGSIPNVQGFQWERGLNGTVRLRWLSVGDGFRYNVYGGYAGPHPMFDTCSDKPVSGTVMTWTPPKLGIKVYDLYTVAVDSKGHEGVPSQHVIIDLRDSQ